MRIPIWPNRAGGDREYSPPCFGITAVAHCWRARCGYRLVTDFEIEAFLESSSPTNNGLCIALSKPEILVPSYGPALVRSVSRIG